MNYCVNISVFFICYSFIIYSLLHWVFVAPLLGELGLLFVVVHSL